MALACGCQSTTPAPPPLVLFPPPPAAPRIQFLTWASGADQVEPGQTRFQDFILGEKRRDLGSIDKPYGVAARDGVVYVCDSKGLCICRLDFKHSTYSVFGDRGPGRLRKPINIVIDPLGYKFVVDPVRKQVVVFDPQDRYATALSIPEPCRPVDVALYENELYVLDNDTTCQIVVLDRESGKVLRTFGSLGDEPGQFKLPSSLCIGPKGFLYVSDTMNWRIQKLTRTGEPVWTRGTPGYTLSRFGRPRGIRVGPDGVVYVVDGATELVQMFSEDGDVLMHFGGPGTSPGAMNLPSSLAIDATSVPYFRKYVHEKFAVDHLLFVANQFGPYPINIYAFGSFPPGYTPAAAAIAPIEAGPEDAGLPPVDDSSDTDTSPDTPDKPGPEDPDDPASPGGGKNDPSGD
ncbi:MAG: hypothetical protein ACE5EX_03065 [Phycisphaerae bacterium]